MPVQGCNLPYLTGKSCALLSERSKLSPSTSSLFSTHFHLPVSFDALSVHSCKSFWNNFRLKPTNKIRTTKTNFEYIKCNLRLHVVWPHWGHYHKNFLVNKKHNMFEPCDNTLIQAHCTQDMCSWNTSAAVLMGHISVVLWPWFYPANLHDHPYTECIKMIGAVSICHYGYQNARRSNFPKWNERAGVQVLCACATPLPSSLSVCDVT